MKNTLGRTLRRKCQAIMMNSYELLVKRGTFGRSPPLKNELEPRNKLIPFIGTVRNLLVLPFINPC